MVLIVAANAISTFERDIDDAILEQIKLLGAEDEALIDDAEDALFGEEDYEESAPSPTRLGEKVLYLERRLKEESKKRRRLERGMRKLVKAFRLTTANIKSQHKDKDKFYDFLKGIMVFIGTGGIAGLGGYAQLHRKTNKIRNGNG